MHKCFFLFSLHFYIFLLHMNSIYIVHFTNRLEACTYGLIFFDKSPLERVLARAHAILLNLYLNL